MLLTRQKIAGVLCVFPDFSTQSAAFWAAKMGAGAIGTASNIQGLSFCFIEDLVLSMFRYIRLVQFVLRNTGMPVHYGLRL